MMGRGGARGGEREPPAAATPVRRLKTAREGRCYTQFTTLADLCQAIPLAAACPGAHGRQHALSRTCWARATRCTPVDTLEGGRVRSTGL